MKQSIYRFRLAKPELFLEKYNSYSVEGGKYQRIDLHRNFRSRGEVLNSVNELFFRGFPSSSLEILQRIASCTSLLSWYSSTIISSNLRRSSFAAVLAIRTPSFFSVSMSSAMKAMREQVKDCIKGIAADFFFQDYAQMEADERGAARYVRVMVKLTLSFSEKFPSSPPQRSSSHSFGHGQLSEKRKRRRI